MPPKDKKKGKHETQEVHPHVLRSREQRRIKAQKEFARGIKKLNKKGKQKQTDSSFSTNSDTSIVEPVQYATGGEESEIRENINPSPSSIHEPSTSCASEPLDLRTDERKNRDDFTSAEEKSHIATRAMNIAERKDPKHLAEIGEVHSPDILKNCPPDDEKQKLLEAKIKMDLLVKSEDEKTNEKEPVISRSISSSTREKSLMSTRPKVPVIPKKLAGSKQSGSKIAQTGKDIFQKALHSSDYDARLGEGEKEYSSVKLIAMESPKPINEEKQKLLLAKIKRDLLMKSEDEKANEKEPVISTSISSSTREKSLMSTRPKVPVIPTKLARSKQSGSKIVQTGKDIFQKALHSYDYDARLGESLKEDRSVKLIAMESPKPIKSTELRRRSSKKVLPKAEKGTSENLLKRKESLERKLKIFESEIKLQDKQKKELLQQIKRNVDQHENAMVGNISLLPSTKLDRSSDNKSMTYSYYNPNTNIIRAGDENIKIIIVVNSNSQIICNSTRRSVVDSDQDNFKSCSETVGSRSAVRSDKDVVSDSEHQNETADSKSNSSSIGDFPGRSCQTVEDQATVKPDNDFVADSEQHDKTTTDSKGNSSSVSDFPGRSCQTVEDQTTVKPVNDFVIDSEQYDKTTTDLICDSRRVSKFSEGNDSYDVNDLRENVKKLCDGFLKDFTSSCENFETRVLNHIDSDKSKS